MVWDELAAAGISTPTLGMRGHGERGRAPYDQLTDAQQDEP